VAYLVYSGGKEVILFEKEYTGIGSTDLFIDLDEMWSRANVPADFDKGTIRVTVEYFDEKPEFKVGDSVRLSESSEYCNNDCYLGEFSPLPFGVRDVGELTYLSPHNKEPQLTLATIKYKNGFIVVPVCDIVRVNEESV